MTARFIDAHIHLWDLNAPSNDYSWLLVKDDPLLGAMAEVQIPLWDADRFAAESRHTRPEKVVHVQAAGPPGDPVAETAWLVGQHDKGGVPDAIVARVDLRAADSASVIARHRECTDLVRGVRDMTTMGALDDPAVPRGLAAVAEAGLSWELACTWEQMPIALALARAQPDLAIVVGHAGFPLARDEEYLRCWRAELRELAVAPNVHCKISGLGMGDHGWTIDSWRPLILDCLEVFGAHRCMVGSNWPVDRLYASYDAVTSALGQILGDLSPDERDAVLYTNAERFYSI